ncbi:hypothetical protein ACIP39_05545 [Streptomyces tibetensis]|uniref:hypothetical protein n=1 Tax=Streptomyces tibetensis TaxID=2382123 RepID=UPI0037F58443
MSISRTLLGLLESGPRHGYDLKRVLYEKFGHDRPLHYGDLRSMRTLTDRKSKGDPADQLIRDHALFHLEADPRRLQLTAARLDELRKAVTR